MRRRREQISWRPGELIADPAHYKGDALTSSPALETVDIGLAHCCTTNVMWTDLMLCKWEAERADVKATVMGSLGGWRVEATRYARCV